MALRAIEIAAKQKRRTRLSADLKKLEQRRRQLRADESALEARLESDEALTEELEQAVEENAQALTDVENDISDIQTEIQEITDLLEQEGIEGDDGSGAQRSRRSNAAFRNPASAAPVDSPNYRSRSRCFTSRSARDAFYQRDDIKAFLQRVRDLGSSGRRSVNGAELNIPQVMLDLIRDNLGERSKLIGKVRLRTVNGTARANVVGTVPEGIWTEMCASLSELEFAFTQIELDGYKVGGYIPICNATLADSDVNLGEEIMDMLLTAIGIGIDKAIVYGKGPSGKMPVGFVTRLAQTAQPDFWGVNEGTWTNLSASNVLKLDLEAASGTEFFAPLIGAMGVADPAYANGKGTFWVMNRKTHMDLKARALAFNSAATLVAGMDGTMPVEGGEIIELEFMPDYEFAGGFGDLYLLAERQGASVSQSEHVRFLEDQTVFKGTARYDGKPVRGEGFVVVNYVNVAPTTVVEFAP